jgi:hypothetical protein
MITVPGVVIVTSGAAMVAFADRSQPWTDGLSLIALICIVVGGAMTVGGLLYWFIAWFRYKPHLLKSGNTLKKNSVAPPVVDAEAGARLQMEAVYTYPTLPTDSSTNGISNSIHEVGQSSSETIFTVP